MCIHTCYFLAASGERRPRDEEQQNNKHSIGTNKQTNKQASKQTHKQTHTHYNKQIIQQTQRNQTSKYCNKQTHIVIQHISQQTKLVISNISIHQTCATKHCNKQLINRPN